MKPVSKKPETFSMYDFVKNRRPPIDKNNNRKRRGQATAQLVDLPSEPSYPVSTEEALQHLISQV